MALLRAGSALRRLTLLQFGNQESSTAISEGLCAATAGHKTASGAASSANQHQDVHSYSTRSSVITSSPTSTGDRLLLRDFIQNSLYHPVRHLM
jgi:hypothetical protein